MAVDVRVVVGGFSFHIWMYCICTPNSLFSHFPCFFLNSRPPLLWELGRFRSKPFLLLCSNYNHSHFLLSFNLQKWWRCPLSPNTSSSSWAINRLAKPASSLASCMTNSTLPIRLFPILFFLWICTSTQSFFPVQFSFSLGIEGFRIFFLIGGIEIFKLLFFSFAERFWLCFRSLIRYCILDIWSLELRDFT